MRVTGKYVFFWTGKDIYSNFYYSPFVHQGILFKWSEQAVMYRKAMLFGSKGIAKKILEASEPRECKSLGRSKHIPFDGDVWDKNKERIYKEVLYDKFQLPPLKKEMLGTGDRLFVEASPYDTVWGIGMRENHPDVTDSSKWRGQNLLGKVLTEVREQIKKEEQENKTR